MQEHLIPQDISNYRFHLIGQLDLIQFGEIMFGIIGGVIIFQTNWPAFVKWPLIVIVVSIGLVAAFFPIGDRPLSHWLKIYFAGLFSPTKFYWRKQVIVPAFFDFVLSDQHKAFLEQVSTFNASPVKRHRALTYFDTLDRNQAAPVDELEMFSNENVAKISTDIIQENRTAPPPPKPQMATTPAKVVVKPNLKAEQTERTRQIITPSQKTLDQYLNNARIFKPKEVTEQISTIGESLKSNLTWPSEDRVQTATPASTPASTTFPVTPNPAPQSPPPTVNVSSSTPTSTPAFFLPSLTPSTPTTLSSPTDALPTTSAPTTAPIQPTFSTTIAAKVNASPAEGISLPSLDTNVATNNSPTLPPTILGSTPTPPSSSTIQPNFSSTITAKVNTHTESSVSLPPLNTNNSTPSTPPTPSLPPSSASVPAAPAPGIFAPPSTASSPFTLPTSTIVLPGTN